MGLDGRSVWMETAAFVLNGRGRGGGHYGALSHVCTVSVLESTCTYAGVAQETEKVSLPSSGAPVRCWRTEARWDGMAGLYGRTVTMQGSC